MLGHDSGESKKVGSVRTVGMLTGTDAVAKRTAFVFFRVTVVVMIVGMTMAVGAATSGV